MAGKTSVAVTWFFLAAVGLAEAEVRVGEVLNLTAQGRGGRGAAVESKLLRLLPLGRDRFLVALEQSVSRVDPWLERERIEKQVREQGFTPEKGVRFEDVVSVAFLNRAGAAWSVSSRGLEGLRVPGGVTNELLLLASEVPPCPYGLYRPDRRELVCLDWQLAPVEKHGVPLDFVAGAAAVTGGTGQEVWFFGGQWRDGQGARQPTPWEDRWGLAAVAAYRLLLSSGKWVPLPFGEEDILRQIRQGVKNSARRRLEPKPGGTLVAVVPEGQSSEEVPLVIGQLVTEHDSENHTLEEKYLFFRAVVGVGGLAKWELLPLQFRTGSQGDLALDAQARTATIPAPAVLADFQVLPMSHGYLALWCSFFSWRDENDRKATLRGETRPMQTLAFFAVVGKREVNFVDFSAVKEAARSAARGRFKVLPVPAYLGAVGVGRVALGALCRDGDDQRRCGVIVELDH